MDIEQFDLANLTAIDKIKLLAGMILDGNQWMMRGKWVDFGTIGRAITRPNRTASYMKNVCTGYLKITDYRKAEMEKYIKNIFQKLIYVLIL